MKLNRLLTLCLLAAGPHRRPRAAGSTQCARSGRSGCCPAFSGSQIVEEFGWFIGKRVGLTELDFSAPEIAAFLKGVSAAAAGKESPYTLEKIGPLMDEFMQKKQTAYLGKLKQKNMADNLAFFTKLKENKAIVELPSGLRYEILKAGEGANPKASDTVKVHYTGTLIDGTVFDSSVQRGEPVEFPLGEVIPGWNRGPAEGEQGRQDQALRPALTRLRRQRQRPHPAGRHARV
jgi:FKBP-type peptidyl-prolyl cis-trans isomerase